LLGFRSRLEQARHVEPDVEADTVAGHIGAILPPVERSNAAAEGRLCRK
jgi:hypothetical protein